MIINNLKSLYKLKNFQFRLRFAVCIQKIFNLTQKSLNYLKSLNLLIKYIKYYNIRIGSILKQMAKANGYIISKQFPKQSDNFLQVSMDISADNRILAFGYGPMIKFVNINTEGSFWFEDRKTIGKFQIFARDQNQKINIPNSLRVIRDVKWNCNDMCKNLLGIAVGQSACIYDVQQNQTPDGFAKVFDNNDVMRQGDYPSKFIWFPNSKDIFLCTSSKCDQIVMRDIRSQQSRPKIIFNDSNSSQKAQQKIQDLKFHPKDQNIFATISKNSTIQIFDIRQPSQSISKYQSAIQNYKSNILDWSYDGTQLASVFGGTVKVWSFEDKKLIQKQNFQHKNAISDFKWLRKHPQYLLISEMQQNIVYGYRTKQKKHDLQILVDPRYSGLKKFITDRNEELVLGLTNFQDSKKYNHEMIAVFIDYNSSQSIWSKTKFIKPNSFGLDNQLLFAATKFDCQKTTNQQQCYAMLFKQIQSSARKIQKQVNQIDNLQQEHQKRQSIQKRQVFRNKIKAIKQQRKQLKKKLKQRQLKFPTKINHFQLKQSKVRQKSSRAKLKKSTSTIQQKQSNQSKKNRCSVQKTDKDKVQQQSYSQTSEQYIEQFTLYSEWILSYSQQVQYLDSRYKIQINDKITQLKGQNICKHNSKVAKSIGKKRCAQFWKYLYYFAFPEEQQKYSLSGLYQDKVKIDVHFKDNKVIANCQNKQQMMKKTAKYNIQKLIQSLVDENQLQTAVMACIMIRNKDPKLLTLQFIQPFLVCYKEMLKAMGLTFISTNLSFIAKLNKAVPSPMFRFQIPIGCGQCYRKFNDSRCTCIQVCAICGESLRSSLVIGCKICGHMIHARQYQKLIVTQGNKNCPYNQCQHQCFKV